MTARCDLSDLPVDQCACRLHAPAADRQRQGTTVIARINAAYPGTCQGCGDRFAVDDPIALVLDGGWQHEECAA